MEQLIQTGKYDELAEYCERAELEVRTCTHVGVEAYPVDLHGVGIKKSTYLTFARQPCFYHGTPQAPQCIPSGKVYGALLGVYLVQNEL